MGRPRKCPQELRERAVRLAIESGRPIARVAADLGVHPETLRVWVRQAQADAGERADRLTTVERDWSRFVGGPSACACRPSTLPSRVKRPQTDRPRYAASM